MLPTQNSQQPRYLLLGEILRPHGIRGELRVRLLTDYPERLSEMESVFIGRNPESDDVTRYHIDQIRVHQGYGLLKLKEIDSRDAADLLRELFVMVELENAVPLEEDEIYLYQLIGLNVQTEAGVQLGKLVEVLETGANDVYVVQGDRYGEVLIPVLDSTIVDTDIDQGRLIVNLPEGLLPG